MSTFSLANSLAVLLSAGLVLSIGALGIRLTGIGSREPTSEVNEKVKGNKQARASHNHSRAAQSSALPTILLVVTIALIGSVWLLTRSRIALLAVPTSLLLLVAGAYWQHGKQLKSELSPATQSLLKGLGLTFFCTLIAGCLWLGWKDPLVFTEAAKSLSYRVDYWVATISMIKDHALLGVGLGNFQTFYPRYMLPTASETIADPHNWILDIASTCSMPVACVIVLGLVRLLFRKPTLQQLETVAPANTAPLALGALIGGLGVLLGLSLFELDDPTAAALFVSILLAALLCWSLRSTMEQFISRSTLGPTITAIVMLLCLLVSGSWQAPGLVVPFLCCLGAIRVDSISSVTTRNDWLGKLPLVTSALMLVAFLWQSWSPVLQSNSIVNRALNSAGPTLEPINQARQIDSLNSQWDRFRAQLLVDQALTKDTKSFESAAKEAVQAIDDWAAREPNSFLTGQFAGDRILQLVDISDRHGLDSTVLRKKALEYYSLAVKNRPTSVQLRVQLAYCYFVLNNQSAAETEITLALELSDKTPHEDQKLNTQLIWIPGAPSGLTADAKPPYCRAELVVAWIRSQFRQ